jgi:peptide/nickel transport system permease protein
MGIIGVLCPFILGTTLGSIAGYFGGAVDTILMRVVDVTIAFPFLVLMIAIITVLEPGLTSFYVAITLVGWVSYARLVRAQTLVLKSSDFVLAARSLGYGHRRIMFRHILPNALTPVVSFAPFVIVANISSLVALDFLGFGLPAPTPSWGELISQGTENLTKWWLVFFPLGALFLTLLLVVFIGEAVREAFDPKEYSRLR